MKELHLTPYDDLSTSINETSGDELLKVFLSPGDYRQKVRIYRSNLHIIGKSNESVRIVFSDFNDKIHPDGLQFNTFRTPTMSIFGNKVILENLMIQNDSGRGEGIGQAVALSLYGDEILLRNCHLKGYQDTLFCGPLPKDLIVRYKDFLPKEELSRHSAFHRFENCKIEGDVDFIFGGSTAVFEDCEIEVLNKGYISAPCTDEDTEYGFIFHNCRITNRSNQEIYLARPWREYGSTIFLDCTFTGLIQEERYHDWEKSHYRFHESPYVLSGLSSPLAAEDLERLMGVINRPIMTRN